MDTTLAELRNITQLLLSEETHAKPFFQEIFKVQDFNNLPSEIRNKDIKLSKYNTN